MRRHSHVAQSRGKFFAGLLQLTGVLVAEGATRPRRVERPKAVLVEVSHLVHAGYSGVVQYIAALIPKVFEEQPALGVAAVVLPWVPFVGAHAGALCAARAAVLALRRQRQRDGRKRT